MRIVVVGLGVQGRKRCTFAGKDYFASVDPIQADADYRSIAEVPLSSYDAALLCVPDEPKIELIQYLISHQKHVLVEKPLWSPSDNQIQHIESLAVKQKVFCYTAYNHRFEPHVIKMRALIDSGILGKIYHCRMFYGNGTARLVQGSPWRDKGAGVLPDLGSHLLDLAEYWFGMDLGTFSVSSSRCYENAAPDHVIFASKSKKLGLEMETTLLSWRNHFTCDILAEKGSAHIASLCKWEPTTFTHRTRVLPSGRPIEESITLEQADPTWGSEYQYFKANCEKGTQTDLAKDLWINNTLRELNVAALMEPA